MIINYVPWAQTLVSDLALLVGANPVLSNMVYDFKLDQWDIPQRGTSEDFRVYVDRVLNNSRRLFTDRTIRDISVFDLSPDGAMRTNAWVTEVPSVYYFSWSTRSTTTGLISGWKYPVANANLLIGLFCGPGFMGNYSRSAQPAIDSSWWDSDCVVNTRSQRAPTLKISPYDAPLGTAPSWRMVMVNDLSRGGTPRKGEWNWLGLMDGFDHFDITGWTEPNVLDWFAWSRADKQRWYKAHVDRLRNLP